MPKQHKGGSFKVKPGRQASLGKQVSGHCGRTFKPGSGVKIAGENYIERKDRLVG